MLSNRFGCCEGGGAGATSKPGLGLVEVDACGGYVHVVRCRRPFMGAALAPG